MTTPPRGLFEGRNFMTPDVLAYYKVDNVTWIELSQGRGMRNEPIFGVTVRPDTSPKLSKLCHSRREADYYIRQLVDGDDADE